MTPHEKAKKVFEAYCGSATDRSLQARLARWQVHNFGTTDGLVNALGINEEFHEATGAFLRLSEAAGKVSHSVLKRHQRIRGFEDEEKTRAAIADGLADMLIYATGLATIFRIDLLTLYAETAEEIMQRDWKQFPTDGLTK